jgi:hypothetical protein
MRRKLDQASRVNRPYVRSRPQRRTAAAPSGLTSAAGLTARPTIEQLERRQMLFSLAVTADDVDPNTGIGTVTKFFGYAIPYMGTRIVLQNPQAPTTTTENFGDEPFGPVGSGRFLLASGLRVQHSIAPPGDIAIQSLTNNQQDQDRWMRVRQDQNGEFFSFQFWAPPENPVRQVQARRATFTFTGDGIGDNTGLLTDNVRMDLLAGTQGSTTVIASFTGAALRALFNPPNAALGVGTLTVNAPADQPGFNEVRFTMISPPPVGVNPAFRLTGVTYDVPHPLFVPIMASRLNWGVQAVLSGPVGATATFLDTYGRDMRRTIALGVPNGAELTLVDPNDDGVPEFNDGIGAVHFTGTDARTSLSMWGGAITATDTPPPDADFFEAGFAFKLADIKGTFDDMEAVGYAFAFDVNNNQIRFTGLPPGPGSVIIGSPFVRDNTSGGQLGTYNPAGFAPGVTNPVTTGFTNPNQGFFVDDGSPLGSIYLHGILNGSSRFTNFVNRIYVGYLMGSIAVDGDLGSLIVGTDAGQWSPDPGFTFTNPDLRLDANNKTASQVVVGRTLGSFEAAGRSLVDITVIGDLNSPMTRPARDVFNYYEKEFNYSILPTAQAINVVRRTLANNAFVARQPSDLFRTIDQGFVFGDAFYHNNTIMTAEWVGSISAGVRIKGDLSSRDPLNGEDTNDVYAFAADGTQEISIEGTDDVTGTAPYFRIVDQNGRTIAAPQQVAASGRFQPTRLRFRPDGPGVYYLVVMDPLGGAPAETGFGASEYTVAITGMATATLGEYRTGGGSGFTDLNSGEGNAVVVLSGNIGSLRIGTGISDAAGAEVAPTGTYNTVQTDDDSMSFQGGSFSAPGSLFNITAGSDIGNPGAIGGGSPIDIRIGGDFGTLFTGLSQVVGGGPNEGDMNFFGLIVGGRIASIDVRGGIGMDQDITADPRAPLPLDQVHIVSGNAGGNGDIGFIRVGFHVAGDHLSISTSPGSTLGAFLVSQDVYTDTDPRSGVYLGLQGVPIISGAGSDVRFVDIPRIDLVNSVDVTTPLIGGQAAHFVDDAGSNITISVENAPDGVQVGTVRALPIEGSQGVAIGQISVNLAGGVILHITGTNPGGAGIVSIGHIVVVGGDAGSQIQIDGSVEVDVYSIQSAAAIDAITNTTPGGDLVAVDVGGLNTLEVHGDLGRTRVPGWGPQHIGPQLGLANQPVADVGGALGVPMGRGTTVDDDFNSNIFRPLNDDRVAGGQAYGDDIGVPLDGQLNGLVVRTGGLISVTAQGSIGDVILQGGAAAVLGDVRANSDQVTSLGGFDGVIGNIFAFNIGTVDLGDGLAASDGGPIATTGIVAVNDITQITSSRTSGAVINGAINAFNVNVDALANPDVVDGIGDVTINNGRLSDARLADEFLDGFWDSFNFTDDNVRTGNIGNVRLNNTTMFRTVVTGVDLGNLTLSGPNGIFDASEVGMTGKIESVSAQLFRNSTLNGSTFEQQTNFIQSARDVNRISSATDIQDLAIDITGDLTGSVTAVNITRSTIDVDGELKAVTVTNDLRASTVTTGSLPTLTAGRNIQASTFEVSGAIQRITAGEHIGNSSINVTGPDGRIDTITARTFITGTIDASGPIGTISVTAGDLAATINTTTSRGNVGTLSASGNVNIVADISGSLTSLAAGRNIGSAGNTSVVIVRGNLANATAANGQLFSDLRVGGTITGAVTLGGAIAKPGNDQVGHGSIIAFNHIGSVIINGDFDGSIISYTGGIASVAINNGSFRAGNLIAAFDGSLASVVITNGNLYGDIHADNDITLLKVSGLADGVFGDIGVNPNASGSTSYDSKRNQLPPGVGADDSFQGPTISAGKDIVSIQVTGGNAYETQFLAGRAIKAIAISGGVGNDNQTSGKGSLFAAGDTIDGVTIGGGAHDVSFIAGMVSLGSDGRAGGVGTAADTVKSGNINAVTIAHGVGNVTFSAGINAGADGIYNNADDLSVFGISKINTLNLTGTISNTSAFGDQLSSSVNGNSHITKGGTNLANTNSQVVTGNPVGTQFSGSRTFNNVHGSNITINFTGAGQAFFDAATAKLTLRGTNSSSNLTVSSSNGTINDVDVVTTDDASLGTVKFQGSVKGDSDFIVDGGVTSLTYGDVSGTGTMAIGGDVTTATFASLTGGFFRARNAQTLRVNGQFGNTNSTIFNEARIDLLGGGTIQITGGDDAVISVDRDLTSLTINGAVDRSAIRVGYNLGTFSAPNLSRSFLSAGDSLGTITIGGEVFQSNIAAGADLGTDAAPGGTGTAADTLSTGFITSVNIAGNFRESSLTAGYLRGADGFFGTPDDKVAPGRSTIGPVTIGGNQVGSSRNSEAYRIATSGTVGQVRIAGQSFSGATGNFALEAPLLAPLSIQVTDILVQVDSRVSTANIIFNQPMDASTLSPALSVSEVRGNGEVFVRLVEGIDYTVHYNAGTNTAAVTFSTSVTDRNLPVVPGKPGPGIYRFEFDQNILRAKLNGVRVDGNGDGIATTGDNFSGDTIVGDAGDKVVAETDFIGTNNSLRVDLYPPVNLNIVMDNNFQSDGLPDVNKTFTVRGSIGDHPDNDTNFFRFSGDADLYSITLQAGQILRLGALQGTAIRAFVGLNDANGNAVGGLLATNADVVSLPTTPGTPTDQTFPTDYLIRTTGTYIISVGQFINTPGVISNPNPPPGGLGDYNVTVQVFDDGDTGFNGTTDASNGSDVVNAPPPVAFAGTDGVFGTPDDQAQVVIGNFSFSLNKGADGQPNTADDLVTGTNGAGIVSTRNGNGQEVSTVTAAIGPAGHVGVPNHVTADVDVFHLNAGEPIAPGTRMTVTIKLSDLGADLGSASPTSGADNRGSVQFGVFDDSASSTVSDATLLFSPTDFTPNGGKPNTVIADNGVTRYGYDSNGDFFITFVAPDRIGLPGSSGSLAVYVQGTNNTDYQVQVVTDATSNSPLPTQRQNFLIETNGGSVDWLQVGGVTTNIGAFSARTLGFNGTINGQSVQTYILTNLVAALNSLFQSASAGGSGFDVHFSTNPADFEFQPHSTVFLTSSSDPVNPLFDPFSGFNQDILARQFRNTQPYGVSQHSDPLNTDLEDEAAVFVPSFALLGLTPGQVDVDSFIQSLTAAVGRRAGELMGLRVTDAYPPQTGPFDPFAGDSVDAPPGPGRAYSLLAVNRNLSSPFDSVNRTDFFLGQQNSRSLLEKILSQQ